MDSLGKCVQSQLVDANMTQFCRRHPADQASYYVQPPFTPGQLLHQRPRIHEQTVTPACGRGRTNLLAVTSRRPACPRPTVPITPVIRIAAATQNTLAARPLAPPGNSPSNGAPQRMPG